MALYAIDCSHRCHLVSRLGLECVPPTAVLFKPHAVLFKLRGLGSPRAAEGFAHVLTQHLLLVQLTLAGFCILSGGALLMLMADGLLSAFLNGGSGGKDNTVKVQVVEKTAAGTTTFEV